MGQVIVSLIISTFIRLKNIFWNIVQRFITRLISNFVYTVLTGQETARLEKGNGCNIRDEAENRLVMARREWRQKKKRREGVWWKHVALCNNYIVWQKYDDAIFFGWKCKKIHLIEIVSINDIYSNNNDWKNFLSIFIFSKYFKDISIEKRNYGKRN